MRRFRVLIRSMLKVEFSWFNIRLLRMPCCPFSPPQCTPVLRNPARPCPWSVSRFAMQVSLASVWSSAICHSPVAAKWNMMCSEQTNGPPRLRLASAWNGPVDVGLIDLFICCASLADIPQESERVDKPIGFMMLVCTLICQTMID